MRIGHLVSSLAISVLALGCADHQVADLTDVDRLTADVVSGNVVQLSSPDEFSEGAFTIDFEGLTRGAFFVSGSLADQFIGMTFSHVLFSSPIDPILIGGGTPIPPRQELLALQVRGLELILQTLSRNLVFSFAWNSIRVNPTLGTSLRDFFLVGRDAAGTEIGVVSEPVLLRATTVQERENFTYVFLGLKSTTPISTVIVDDQLPPFPGGGSTIFLDDVTFSPPSPQLFIGLIVNSVEDLVAGGVLKAAQTNGLIKKLEEAIKKLDMGNVTPAMLLDVTSPLL